MQVGIALWFGERILQILVSDIGILPVMRPPQHWALTSL